MWWVLSDEILLAMFERAGQGEKPGVLIAELYANSRSELVDGDG